MSSCIQGSTASHAAKTYIFNVENFQRECDVYRRLGKHQHIAELLDVQHQTIILEKGQCLREILQKGNIITDAQKSNWIQGLACGLEYIHSKNVIHADPNAGNVIIGKGAVKDGDCAKWIDFGGSAIDSHEALACYDEYSYRPPEQPSPAVCKDTDIFAFGCTVFEIETGSPPYHGETKHMSSDETISYVEEKYLERLYPSTANLRFQSIIVGCWQGRYQAMGDLRDDLRSLELP